MGLHLATAHLELTRATSRQRRPRHFILSSRGGRRRRRVISNSSPRLQTRRALKYGLERDEYQLISPGLHLPLHLQLFFFCLQQQLKLKKWLLKIEPERDWTRVWPGSQVIEYPPAEAEKKRRITLKIWSFNSKKKLF